MINITISCDFCGKDSGFTVSCSPGNLLNNYKVFKDDLITAKFWVYHTFNKRWYCPECAEYRNAYEGDRVKYNRDNLSGWHYTEANDLPPLDRDGISETVLNQDGKEVFYSNRTGWLEHDAMQTVRVFKWRYTW